MQAGFKYSTCVLDKFRLQFKFTPKKNHMYSVYTMSKLSLPLQKLKLGLHTDILHFLCILLMFTILCIALVYYLCNLSFHHHNSVWGVQIRIYMGGVSEHVLTNP